MNKSDDVSPLQGSLNQLREDLSSGQRGEFLGVKIRELKKDIEIKGITQVDHESLSEIVNRSLDDLTPDIKREMRDLKEVAARHLKPLRSSKRIGDIQTTASDVFLQGRAVQEKEKDYGPRITLEDVQDIVDYVQKNKEKLFQSAKSGHRYHRREATKLTRSFQVELPKRKDAKPDEMRIVVHLKPKAPFFFKTRERNVILIGEGSFKSVKRSAAFVVGQPNIRYYATATIKSVQKGQVQDQEKLKDAIVEMDNEVKFLKLFKGQRGIVQCIGHCVYPVKTNQPKQWYDKVWDRIFGGTHKMNMVMTYAVGDLDQLQDGPIDTEDREKWTLDLLTGLSSVHEKGIILYDIKPANVLISETGEAELADFGLALFVYQKHGVRGTRMYNAPETHLLKAHYRFVEELIEKKQDTKDPVEILENVERQVGTQSDVYSLGLVLYVMKYNDLPRKDFMYYNSKVCFDNVKKIKSWHLIELKKLFPIDDPTELQKLPVVEYLKRVNTLNLKSEREQALILLMLNPDPMIRITAKEALQEFEKLYK